MFVYTTQNEEISESPIIDSLVSVQHTSMPVDSVVLTS